MRLRAEAEGKRREYEHPDTILDQSRRILEGQQFALARGDMPRSRSWSRSISMEGAESAEESSEIHMAEDIVTRCIMRTSQTWKAAKGKTSRHRRYCYLI